MKSLDFTVSLFKNKICSIYDGDMMTKSQKFMKIIIKTIKLIRERRCMAISN